MKKLLMFTLLLALCCVLLPAIAESTEPLAVYTNTDIATQDDGGDADRMNVQVMDTEYHGDPVYICGNAPLSGFDFSKQSAAILPETVERFFAEPWYTVNSLPYGVCNVGDFNGGNPATFTLLLDDGSIVPDPLQRYAVEFIAGNEQLKDVVSLYPDESRGQTWQIAVIPEKALGTGEATFRITAETEHYIYQQEKTVRFISYDEEPLFASLKVPVAICGDVGGAVKADQMPQYIANRTMFSGDVSKLNTAFMQYWFQGQDGIRYEDRSTPWTAKPLQLLLLLQGGIYRANIPLWYNNQTASVPVIIYATDFRIRCSAVAEPGSTVTCTAEGAEGRTYTWRLEGKGASIDRKSGTVTISPDTPVGSRFFIMATPDDRGTPAGTNILVYPTGFDGAEVTDLDLGSLTIPWLDGPGWNTDVGSDDSDAWIELSSPNADGSTDSLRIFIRSLSSFVHDEATAKEIYDQYLAGMPEGTAVSEITVDGYPARHLEMTRQTENGISRVRSVVFTRDLNLLALDIAHTSADGAPIPDEAWAEQVLSRIRYNADKAVTWEDAQISVTADSGAEPVVTAGKKLQLKAVFRGQEKIVGQLGADPKFTWTLSGPDGAATLTPDGLLTAAKKLDAPVSVLVTAASVDLGPELSATAEVLVLPPAKKIEADTKEVFLYAGTEQAVTVKPVLTPDSIPPRGITWSLKDQGVAALTPGEDGAAVFRPLSAGKTTATVTEPGGKKADVKVTVTDPVTDVELTVSGKPKAGGTVTVKAATLPKSAGNKDVEWSLDVGEDIATVKKGAVKIQKGVPAGTVITVTCTAAGAPEPVVKTVQIVVEDK